MTQQTGPGWCPFAVHRPLPEQGQQRATEEKRFLIFHSAVDGTADSLYDAFADRNNGLESHFYIQDHGGLEQYLSIDQRADANRYANDEAVSVESGDQGDPDRQPWTSEQQDTAVRLGLWVTEVCPRIGRVRATAPGADGHGIGYHTMWGAPSLWTPYVKTCPGRARVLQFPSILRRIQEGTLNEGDLDLMPSQFETLLNAVTKVSGTADAIDSKITTTNDELFHMPAIPDGAVLETGQRKTQFWKLLRSARSTEATALTVSSLNTFVAALIVRQDPELAEALGLTMPEAIAAKLKG